MNAKFNLTGIMGSINSLRQMAHPMPAAVGIILILCFFGLGHAILNVKNGNDQQAALVEQTKVLARAGINVTMQILAQCNAMEIGKNRTTCMTDTALFIQCANSTANGVLGYNDCVKVLRMSSCVYLQSTASTVNNCIDNAQNWMVAHGYDLPNEADIIFAAPPILKAS